MSKHTPKDQTCDDAATCLHIQREDIEKLLKMNRNLARKINNNGYKSDLISIGWIEIENTLPKIDLTRGASPSTCCYWPVKKAMIRAMKREQQHKETEKTNGEFFEQIQDVSFNPAEILIEQEVKETLEQKRHLLKSLLKKLPEREGKILQLRFGLKNGKEFTLQEIGTKLKISKQRVKQLESKGLTLLRQLFEEHGYR